MRILFAEDEEDLNAIVTRKLTEEGFLVDSCFDGREALEYMETASYDAVVLDVMMPGADGFEVLKKMRMKGDGTPVLFLTARDAVSDRMEFRTIFLRREVSQWMFQGER